MNKEAIVRADEVIMSKTDYVGGGMEGYAALSLIDEDGYPSTSTLTISKADGIKWLTFLTGLDSNKAKRIAKCDRASVCVNSAQYNISLVGTVEVLTDPATKKEMWQEPLGHMFSGPDDPQYCVIKFTTKRYSIFFDDGAFTEGAL